MTPRPDGVKPLKVPHEIMRVASERHQKGLMSPWIYQLLSQVRPWWSLCKQTTFTICYWLVFLWMAC